MTRNLLIVFFFMLSPQLKAFVLPPVPTNLTVSEATQTTFKANWDAGADVISYWMDLSTSSNFSTGNVFINKQVQRGEVVQGLLPGTAYYFRVRSMNASGTSANSFIRSLVMIPPTPVGNVVSQDSFTQFTYYWASSIGANEYRVDVATDVNFQNIIRNNISAGKNLQLSIGNLIAGRNYFVRVRAVNSLGSSGNWISGIPLYLPKVLANPATNITSSGFTANWSFDGALNYLTGFEIEIFKSDVDYIKTITAPANARSLQIPIDLPGTYNYIVSAIAEAPSGSSSNHIYFTIPAVNFNSNLAFYPNPVSSSEFLNVNGDKLLPGTNVNVSLTDFNGNAISNYSFTANEEGVLNEKIAVNNLKPGTYLLKVGDKTQRVVIN